MVKFVKEIFMTAMVLGIVIILCTIVIVFSLKANEPLLNTTTTTDSPIITSTQIPRVASIYSSYCRSTKDGSLATLTNITESEVVKGKSIFFHETSCESYSKKKTTITQRQACSVESAARAHPDSDVYLLYSSPGIFQFNGDASDRFLKVLLGYPNVKIMHVDHKSYVNGTYVEKLFKEGTVDISFHKIVHIADILRFLTMHKYGGIYLDLDVIVTKDLWRLGPNFSAIEDDNAVAIGLMGFSPDGVGHEVAGLCLRELRDTYNPKGWGQNGPLMLTRVLRRRCPKAKTAKDLADLGDCAGFKIYDRDRFYKYHYSQTIAFFDPNKVNEFEKAAEESEAIHFWNKITFKTKALKTDRVPIVELAKKFCPNVFSEVDEYF